MFSKRSWGERNTAMLGPDTWRSYLPPMCGRVRLSSDVSEIKLVFSIPSALALMFAKPTLISLAQYGTKPQRAKSKLRSPALASNRTMGS